MCIGIGIGTNYLRNALVPSLSFDWLNTNSLVSSEGYPLTFTRASQATYWGSDGLLKTATNNEARFEYNPNTLVKRGLKIEPQATNLLLYSSTFTNPNWNKPSGATWIQSISSPDGGNMAIRGLGISGTGIGLSLSSLQYVAINLQPSTTYSFSVHMRANGVQSGTAGLRVKTDGGATNFYTAGTTLTSNWVRLFMTFTTTTGGATDFVIGSVSGTINADIFGAQLEQSSSITSYIPTTTATVTRSADLATMSTGIWYNASEGSILSNYVNKGINTTTGQSLYGFTDGTFSNRMLFRNYASGNGQAVLIGAYNGTVNMTLNSPSISIDSTYRMASGFKSNDYALCINNIIIISSTGIFTNLINRLDIGNAINSEIFNGYIQSFKYYPTKLPNATLQALTA